MSELSKKAELLLSDADSGSAECKHYNNGFLDGVKFAEQQLKNCNLQNASNNEALESREGVAVCRHCKKRLSEKEKYHNKCFDCNCIP